MLSDHQEPVEARDMSNSRKREKATQSPHGKPGALASTAHDTHDLVPIHEGGKEPRASRPGRGDQPVHIPFSGLGCLF